MGYWDYVNVGASANINNKGHIEKIFEYIGYAPEPDYAPDGEECSFYDPDVYCCKYSANDSANGNIKDSFKDMSEEDLLYLLNALFIKTNVYVHHAEGNNTSDTWENHDIIYNVEDMTCYRNDSYTDYGGSGPNGKRSSKARFILKAPRAEFINALINLSIKDGNMGLTTLLQDLAQKLKEGLVVYEDNPEDSREIDNEYDIQDNVEGELNDEYDEFDEDEDDEEDYEEGEFENE